MGTVRDKRTEGGLRAPRQAGWCDGYKGRHTDGWYQDSDTAWALYSIVKVILTDSIINIVLRRRTHG